MGDAPTERLLSAFMHSYWRLSRGLTMGAQGIVLDGEERVLLVRHGYRSGWHFPGGGVERGETVGDALERELREETGVILKGPADLHGIFANFRLFPGDHVAVFIVRNWHQPVVPKPTREIAECRFFPTRQPPTDLAPGARRRLDEIVTGRPADPNW